MIFGPDSDPGNLIQVISVIFTDLCVLGRRGALKQQ